MVETVVRGMLANLFSPLAGLVLLFPYTVFFFSGRMAREPRPPRVIFAYSIAYVVYLQVALHFSTALEDAKNELIWEVPFGAYLLYPFFFTLLVVMHATESRRRFRSIVAAALLTNAALVTLSAVEQQYRPFQLPDAAVNASAIRSNVGGTVILVLTLAVTILLYPRFFAAPRPLAAAVYAGMVPALVLDAVLFAAVLCWDSPNFGAVYPRIAGIIAASNLFVSAVSLGVMYRFLEGHRAAVVAAHQYRGEPARDDRRWRAARALGGQREQLRDQFPGQWVVFLAEERLGVAETYDAARKLRCDAISDRRSAHLCEADFLIEHLRPEDRATRMLAAPYR